MTRTFLAALTALGLASAFVTAPADAKMRAERDVVAMPADLVGEHTPRSILDQIRDSAP